VGDDYTKKKLKPNASSSECHEGIIAGGWMLPANLRKGVPYIRNKKMTNQDKIIGI